MKITRRRFLSGGGMGLAAIGLEARVARAATLPPGIHPLGLDRVRDGVIYVPEAVILGMPLPLAIAFHGAGSSGRACQYAFAMAEEFPHVIVAPDSRDEKTWDVILGHYGDDQIFIEAAFAQAVRQCPIDRTRLTIMGHSDGGSYALSFGIGVGDLFGHIMAYSPGVMTPVAARGKPRVFISHGISDRTMPIDDTSRKFAPRLTGLGYDVTYREYEGGHGVPTDIVRDSFKWLTAR
jgi:phospholipase/carboxylesterase